MKIFVVHLEILLGVTFYNLWMFMKYPMFSILNITTHFVFIAINGSFIDIIYAWPTGPFYFTQKIVTSVKLGELMLLDEEHLYLSFVKIMNLWLALSLFHYINFFRSQIVQKKMKEIMWSLQSVSNRLKKASFLERYTYLKEMTRLQFLFMKKH